MTLRIVSSSAFAPGNVRRFGKEWGATGSYYFNWIVGFETKEDAEIVAEALRILEDNLRDAMFDS